MKLSYSRDDLRAVPLRDGSVIRVDMRDSSKRCGEATGNYRDAVLARPYDARDPYGREIGGES